MEENRNNIVQQEVNQIGLISWNRESTASKNLSTLGSAPVSTATSINSGRIASERPCTDKVQSNQGNQKGEQNGSGGPDSAESEQKGEE